MGQHCTRWSSMYCTASSPNRVMTYPARSPRRTGNSHHEQVVKCPLTVVIGGVDTDRHDHKRAGEPAAPPRSI